MANSQADQGVLEETQDSSKDKDVTQPVGEGEEEALHTARSELRKTMSEVAENPPVEQPPPPSVLTQEIIFEEPVPDPYNKAISYLERHSILQLFQNMTASIVFRKPDNPLDFMISEIADMKKLQETKKSESSKK